jgi:DNA repair exonuclease SbcCD ATPase subunit
MNTAIIQEQLRAQQSDELAEQLKNHIEKKSTSKSILSLLADHFYHLPWWKKIILCVISVCIGGSVGFFSWPIFFPFSSIAGGILGLVAYMIPSKILSHHYNHELEHHKKIAEEILKLEQVFDHSIQNVQALEKPMHSLLNELEEKNKSRAHSNQLFKETVESFKHQSAASAEVVDKLQEHEQDLRHQNQYLSSALEDTVKVHQDLNQTEKGISQVHQTLQETQGNLEKNVDIFNRLTSSIENRNQELDTLYEKFKTIEKHAIDTQHFFEKHLRTLENPRSMTLCPQETVDEINQSSQALGKEVLNNLEAYLSKQKNHFFKQSETRTEQHFYPNHQI